jgi:hypothetical protein
MYTSVTLVALSGLLAAAPVSESPTWSTDYRLARKEGQNKHKPLAVFIGSGPKGWNQVSESGTLGKEIKKLLAEHYVCVYLDTSKRAGKTLAADFEMTEGAGIILSDGACRVQAFRHEGDLSTENLDRYLRRYADPERVARYTETNPEERTSYYPQEQPAPVYAPPVFSGWGGARGC